MQSPTDLTSRDPVSARSRILSEFELPLPPSAHFGHSTFGLRHSNFLIRIP
jgi:hypothetical protein